MSARDMILDLYRDRVHQPGRSVNADTRMNSLVVRGPRELLANIEALLITLDEAEPANRDSLPNPDSASNEINVYQLRRVAAAEARVKVLQLLPGKFGKGNRGITADTRTNSLAVWGPRDLQSAIAAALVTIDNGSAGRDSLADGAEASRGPLGEDYRQHEDQGARLAAAYRTLQTATPPDREKLEQLKSQLRDEVSAAFEARQEFQRADLKRLRGRLAQIERQIEARQERAQEIINNRIEELLHPEEQWETGDESTVTATKRAGMPAAGDRTTDRRDAGSATRSARAALAQADKALGLARDQAGFTSRLEKKGYANAAQAEAAAADLAAKEIRRDQARADLEQAEKHAALIREEEPRGDTSVRQAERAGAPRYRESAANPRKALLDAEVAVATARATVAQADKAILQARELAKRVRELAKQGAVPQKELLSSEAELAAQEARRDRAIIDMDQAERQAELAREDLAAQVELLKIDLEEARLQLENASSDEQRAKNLLDRSAISKEEYVAKALAERQAELQVQRATRLLDLYRKALPGAGVLGEKTTREDNSTSKRGGDATGAKKEE